jgi:ParB-like chromosome segregation protein Spo0J
MQIRDRIKEFRRVKASQLRPHPKNWRTHPPAQQNALRGVLAEIGYAGALLARELPDGSLELIDGHLRAETTPEVEVPVLILDLDDREAAKLLALHDPLAGMAEANGEVLADLLGQVETENDAVQALLDEMLAEPEAPPAEPEVEPAKDIAIPEAFQVVIECRDESEQQSVFERMTKEGYTCRLLNL